MATFSTNFGNYTVDQQPVGWTPRWTLTNATWLTKAKTGTEAGKVLEKISSVDARRFFSLDALDNAVDVEILVRFRTSLGGSSSYTQQIRLGGRCSGEVGAETGYQLNFSTTAGGAFNLFKYVNGVSSNIGGQYDNNSFVADTWYYLRFRINGSALSAKIWLDGDEEPTSWQVSVDDTSISAGGWAGLGNYESSGTVDFDFFSYGTGGDAAPLPVSTETEIRIAGAQLQTLVTASEPELRIAGASLQTLVTASEPELRIAGASLQTLVTASEPELRVAGVLLQVLVKNLYIDPAALQQPKLIVCM